MKAAYFIYELFQTGNVGAYNCKRITEQPAEGFGTYELAEEHIERSMEDEKKWTFQQAYNFTILKVYTNK